MKSHFLEVPFVTFLVVCGIVLPVNGLEIGDHCRAVNNLSGTCRFIYECAQAIKDIKDGHGRVLCKNEGLIEVVCCADHTTSTSAEGTITQPITVPTPVDISQLRLADRKCHEYSEYVYQNESLPSLIIGTRPIVKRVDKCGFKVVKFIVGGTEAAPKEFPHMAHLGYGPEDCLRWECAGTIISRRFILTAAHCVVSPEPTFVRIGDLNFNISTDDADPQVIQVLRAIPHPSYKSTEDYHDIGLLELAEEMQFNPYVRPACLHTQFAIPVTRAIASGWGRNGSLGSVSGPLLKVTLDLFPFDKCQPLYEKDQNLSLGLVENQHLCAGSYDSEKDTCDGDSGGPLQVYHNLYCMYNIVGVTSFGEEDCGTIGLPAVYTRVSNYIDWIESIAFGSG